MACQPARNMLLVLVALCMLGMLRLTSAFTWEPDLETASVLSELSQERLAQPIALMASSGNVSEECLQDLEDLISNSSKLLPVLDALGKPASGILAGNLAWMGHFDQCMAILEYRHCLVEMIANLSAVSSVQKLLPFQWGVCVPETCSEEDVLKGLDILIDYYNVTWLTLWTVQSSKLPVHCTNKPNTSFDAGAIATCAFLSFLAGLCMLASLVDHCLGEEHSSTNRPSPAANGSQLTSDSHQVTGQRGSNHYEQVSVEYSEPEEIVNKHQETAKPPTERTPLLSSGELPVVTVTREHRKKPSGLVKLLLCFSISRNLPKILSTKQAEGGIPCLNGIRVISISWVILGHTLVFISQAQANENLMLRFPAWVEMFSFQVIANAFLAVDTFFFLSGLLVTFLTLKALQEQGGRLNWAWFYIHRYIRLTPIYAVLILILTFLLPNLNQGPLWFLTGQTVSLCKQWWWTDILYINNFVPNGFTDCVVWGWYLANDMQFFIISPLLLLSLFWFPVLGVVAVCVLLVASFITSSVIVFNNHLDKGNFLSIAGYFLPAVGGISTTFMNEIYSKPYCRIPPYLVGMAMGAVLYWTRNRRIKLSQGVALAGWLAATGLGVTVVYGLYNMNRGLPTTELANAMYTSLSAFTWGLALCWVVFACHYQSGGLVNVFLSWSVWAPLSRLTYATYLIHPVVIQLYSMAQTTPFHWSIITWAYMFVSFLVLSHVVALLACLLIEFPVGNMEKLLRQRLMTKKPADTA